MNAVVDIAVGPAAPLPRPISVVTRGWGLAVRLAVGLSLVMSLTMPWPAEGFGSTLPANEVSALAYTTSAVPLVTRLFALSPYVVAFSGAGLLAVTGVWPRRRRSLRAALLVLAGTALLAGLYALDSLGLDGFGPGAWLATAAVGAGLVAEGWGFVVAAKRRAAFEGGTN